MRCGDVITEDTRLKEDLLDCPGNGLEIGADGITLDLEGHVIDGTGAGSGIRSHGNTDVQIVHGTIREFNVGVSLGRAQSFPGGAERGAPSHDHLLSHLTVRDNGTGISLFRVDDNSVEHTTLIRNGVGISLTEASHNRVAKNGITDNGTGVSLFAGDDNRVLKNRVTDNKRVGIAVGGSLGAPFAASDNLIAKNAVSGNGGDGILVATAGTGNLVEKNRSDANGDDGIDVDCWQASCAPGQITLTANSADRNADLGIEADPGTGDGGRNRARRNGDPSQCVEVSCF